MRPENRGESEVGITMSAEACLGADEEGGVYVGMMGTMGIEFRKRICISRLVEEVDGVV